MNGISLSLAGLELLATSLPVLISPSGGTASERGLLFVTAIPVASALAALIAPADGPSGGKGTARP